MKAEAGLSESLKLFVGRWPYPSCITECFCFPCSAARTYDEVRMGTEGYIGQEGGNTVACINQDGNLRCGTAEGWLPIDETIFCMVSIGGFPR